MNNPLSAGQSDLFPELIPHSGHGSGSAMVAMLRKRREVATESASLVSEPTTAESTEQHRDMIRPPAAGDHATV